ncbi:leucine--tRNA ligase [Pyrus ussuriensis x Pyrus communis]|uniref:Leucine--tRNA ligase n=1 Tax=Pyrus ussuriensis x Pyrus communis TaxID=2448454 RepID=A0A5N5GP57_9ROSA|nr:leucine--tRNA ligase [Pyrus ussuriensis x Pyrus communis]
MKLITRSPNTIFLMCSLIPGRGFYALFRRMRMPSENSNARFLLLQSPSKFSKRPFLNW